MKPFSRSIIELFDGKRRYVIPMFQRQYAWREDRQLVRLWEDTVAKARLRLDGKEGMPHFLGAIVIALLSTYGRQIQAYDVIDGQQRLTTFQILLIAFRDVATLHESDFSDELNQYILNDGLMEDKAVERFKVWPSKVDRRQINLLVDSGSKKSVDAKINTEVEKREIGSSPLMIAAYNYFHRQIEDFVNKAYRDSSKGERIEALFVSLKRDLALVSIELEGGDDPQVIFETLNGFGEPLLPSDLMRNFIFQRAYRQKHNQADKTPEFLYNEYWLDFDKHFWKVMEKQGRLKRPRVDIFFQHFLSMKKAQDINVGRLYYEYKTWIEGDRPYSGVEEELKDASSLSKIYTKLLKPDEPSELSSFSKLLDVFDVKTIHPLVLFLCGEKMLSGEDLDKALLLLSSYLVRRAICGLTTKNYNRFFLQLVQKLRANEYSIRSLQEELAKNDGEAVVWPTDQQFLHAWKTGAHYDELGSAKIQYLLKNIENAMRTEKNEKVDIKSTLTVEHIMPDSWYENWPLSNDRKAESWANRLLKGLLDEEADKRDKMVDNIGNLTLLTQPFNSSLQNNSYSKKKPEILAQSALTLNRCLAKYNEWDEKAIEARGDELFAYALKIWPRSVA